MKKGILLGAGVLVVVGLWLGLAYSNAEWSGVDETVVEHFAHQAGRSAQDPLINTDQGDLLLFVFLSAGIVGGFVAGYYFRELFPPKRVPRPGEG